MIEAVLFDLDGTFADTAPDLGAALNRLRGEQQLAPMPLAALRPYTSQGVRGMLRAGLGMMPDDPHYRHSYDRFLHFYSNAVCVHTSVFDGIAPLLSALEGSNIAWGIVTNKAQRFTLPLLAQLGYDKRAACIVSGDSAPRAKPAAQPMHLACTLLGRVPTHCLYVGDDLRDVQAWGADHIVDHAGEIAALAGVAC